MPENQVFEHPVVLGFGLLGSLFPWVVTVRGEPQPHFHLWDDHMRRLDRAGVQISFPPGLVTFWVTFLIAFESRLVRRQHW